MFPTDVLSSYHLVWYFRHECTYWRLMLCFARCLTLQSTVEKTHWSQVHAFLSSRPLYIPTHQIHTIPFMLFLSGVDAWWTNFKGYIDEEKNISDWRSTLNQTGRPNLGFPFLLSEFLHSRQGSKYKRNFHFDGNLTCNFPAPPITVCTRVSNNLTFTFFTSYR